MLLPLEYITYAVVFDKIVPNFMKLELGFFFSCFYGLNILSWLVPLPTLPDLHFATCLLKCKIHIA